MALNATIHSFDVTLNDADRGVYESLSFRVARHPSETPEFLMTRVLAYCLEFAPGLEFSRGLSEPDMPALSIRDLTGALQAWIEVGAPDAARLHKASKSAPRVAVYCHRDVEALLGRLETATLHRRESLEVHAVDRPLLAALCERLERRMAFDLAVSERHLYVTLDSATLSGEVATFGLGVPR